MWISVWICCAPKMISFQGGIKFSEILNYYDEDKRTYTIPYNPKTHEFQEPDYRNIKDLPKDIIAVEFPSERLLDRIGWNRKYGFDMKHGLRINGLTSGWKRRKSAGGRCPATGSVNTQSCFLPRIWRSALAFTLNTGMMPVWPQMRWNSGILKTQCSILNRHVRRMTQFTYL